MKRSLQYYFVYCGGLCESDTLIPFEIGNKLYMPSDIMDEVTAFFMMRYVLTFDAKSV